MQPFRFQVVAILLGLVGCAHGSSSIEDYCSFQSVPMGQGRFHLEVAWSATATMGPPKECFYRRALQMCSARGYNSFFVGFEDRSTHGQVIAFLGDVTCETRLTPDGGQ